MFNPLNQDSRSYEILPKLRDDQLLQQKNFASYYKGYPQGSDLYKFFNEGLGSVGRDSGNVEKKEEKGSYSYNDDDQFYHLNIKREDDTNSSDKQEKVDSQEIQGKENLNDDKVLQSKNNNENNNDNESQTIEMLSFKESHGSSPQTPESIGSIGTSKSLKQESNNKDESNPSKESQINDLNKKVGVDEKLGESKHQTSEIKTRNNGKRANGKQEEKLSESKEIIKNKQPSFIPEVEKKDEIKCNKDSESGKSLKENVKTDEEKDKVEEEAKNTKLTESLKPEESSDSKIKEEQEPNKISKETENTQLVDSSENDKSLLSKVDNKANLISKESKDNSDALPISGQEVGEKSSEDLNEKNVQLNEERNDESLKSQYISNQGTDGEYQFADYSQQMKQNKKETLNTVQPSSEMINGNPDFTYKNKMYLDGLQKWNEIKKGAYTPDVNPESLNLYKNYLKILNQYMNNQNKKDLNNNKLEFSKKADTYKKKKRSKKVRNRKRRKLPNMLEYEIKIVNHKNQESKNIPLVNKNRRKKETSLKSWNTPSNTLIRRHPYSEISRGKFIDFDELYNEKEGKLSVWKRSEDSSESDEINRKSKIKPRGAPFGYYGNRVKFGQKRISNNDEIDQTEIFSTTNWISPYNQKSDNKRSWEVPSNFEKIHSPVKNEEKLNKKLSNSLVLLKKDKNGEKVVNTFMDATQKDPDIEAASDKLAKILSKDNDYIILKRTQNNNFQKIEEEKNIGDNNNSPPLLYQKNIELDRSPTSINPKVNKNEEDFYKRINRSNEEKLQKSQSSLKKTFDKFEKLADLFKDDERLQSADKDHKGSNQIEFFDDNLPKFMATSDTDNKLKDMKPKVANSIASLSNNFKKSDQKFGTDISESNGENTDKDTTTFTKSSWEPALRSVFPEAKKVTSIQKNGNDIVVIDFDRNYLQLNQQNKKDTPSNPDAGTEQSNAPVGNSEGSLKIPGDRQIGLVLNNGAFPSFLESKSAQNTPGLSTFSLIGPYIQSNNIPTSVPQNEDRTRKSISAKNNKNSDDNLDKSLNKNLEEVGVNISPQLSNSFPGLSLSENTNSKYLESLLQTLMKVGNFGLFGNEGTKDWNLSNNKQDEKYSNGDTSSNNKWIPNSMQFDVTPEMKVLEPLSSVPTKTAGKNTRTAESMNQGQLKIRKREEKKDYNTENNKQENLPLTLNNMKKFGDSELKKNKMEKFVEDSSSFTERQSFDTNKNLNKKFKVKLQESYNKLEPNEIKDSNSKQENFGSEDSGNIQEEYTRSFEGSNNQLKVKKKKKKRSAIPLKTEFKWERQLNGESLAYADGSKKFSSFRHGTDSGRSSRNINPGLKSKVSSLDRQNKILRLSDGDSDQSIHSSEVRRKPLSIDVESANENTNGEGSEKVTDKITREIQPKKSNKLTENKIDPILLNFFNENDAEMTLESNNRAVRSYPNDYHSNYKREIELDESRPNDFQNFLVTSLGMDSHGLGYENHKNLKKEQEFQERKENFPSNYDDSMQVHSDKDSFLKKRDVSNKEKQNNIKLNIKDKTGYSNNVQVREPNNVAEISSPKSELRDKSSVEAKLDEINDEKSPTQIRIQITKASLKEKKSSKPIMDENDNSSNEMETTHKEKEFFEKNNPKQVYLSIGEKVHHPLKYGNAHMSSYGKKEKGADDRDSGARIDQERYYKMRRNYRRGRRKNKKFSEGEDIKSVQDMYGFDTKAMETLMKKFFVNQNNQGMNVPKLPVSNHLPLVETVYNPAQETIKAQIEGNKHLLKPIAVNKQNTMAEKNKMHVNTESSREKLMQPYSSIKASELKSKRKSKLATESSLSDTNKVHHSSSAPARLYKNFESNPSQGARVSKENLYKGTHSQLNRDKTPFSHFPATFSNKKNNYKNAAESRFDSKRKEEFRKSFNSFKPSLGRHENVNSLNRGSVEKETSEIHSPFSHISVEGLASQNQDSKYFLPKNDNPSLLKHRIYISHNFKTPLSERLKVRHSSNRNKYNFLNNQNKRIQSEPMMPANGVKDYDYLEPFDDDYFDGNNINQDSQFDDNSGMTKSFSNGNKYQNAGYKNDNDQDSLGNDDSELDDDYEENIDEDNYDYSLLSSSNPVKTEAGRNSAEDETKTSHYDESPAFPSIASDLKPKTTDLEIRKSLNDVELETTGNEKLQPDSESNSFVDVDNDIDIFDNSANVLKMANKKSNILGQNLMKNLNSFNYDNSMQRPVRFEPENPDFQKSPSYDIQLDGLANKRLEMYNQLRQNKKSKRNRIVPKEVGRRIIYATKIEAANSESLIPGLYQSKQRLPYYPGNNVCYQPINSNPFIAELRDAENEFDNDSDEEIHFSESILDREKENDKKRSYSDVKKQNENEQSKSESLDLSDMKLKSDGEGKTISEDNILENVIGKYIMRKRLAGKQKIKSSSINSKLEKKLYEKSDDIKKARKRKRSINDQEYFRKNEDAKVVGKRLSSGHLTETNFKKFHKKNPKQKRQTAPAFSCKVNGVGASSNSKLKSYDSIVTITDSIPSLNDKDLEKLSKDKTKNKKRSALNLFKKMRSKDKDLKNVDNADVRTVGFEPIFVSKETAFGVDKPMNQINHQKETLASNVAKQMTKSALINSGKSGKATVWMNNLERDNQKNNVKGAKRLDEDVPWKVELNERYDISIQEKKPQQSENNPGLALFHDTNAQFVPRDNQNVKAYLVIRKNVRSANDVEKSAEVLPPTSGAIKREVGTCYLPKYDQGLRLSKRNLRKQSVDGSSSKYVRTSEQENLLSRSKVKRALQGTETLSEEDFQIQTPHIVQRNSETDFSFGKLKPFDPKPGALTFS